MPWNLALSIEQTAQRKQAMNLVSRAACLSCYKCGGTFPHKAVSQTEFMQSALSAGDGRERHSEGVSNYPCFNLERGQDIPNATPERLCEKFVSSKKSEGHNLPLCGRSLLTGCRQ